MSQEDELALHVRRHHGIHHHLERMRCVRGKCRTEVRHVEFALAACNHYRGHVGIARGEHRPGEGQCNRLPPLGNSGCLTARRVQKKDVQKALKHDAVLADVDAQIAGTGQHLIQEDRRQLSGRRDPIRTARASVVQGVLLGRCHIHHVAQRAASVDRCWKVGNHRCHAHDAEAVIGHRYLRRLDRGQHVRQHWQARKTARIRMCARVAR
mmetsp:Transcript_51737/g.144583  ORF Transcript_51737/g.144583 Transcript_51737/m.144583 type:complete len:210 (-) Transcript_51737:64-693(-)